MLKNAIPFVDLRGKTPVDLLRAYPDKGRALVAAARRTLGFASLAASAVALPLTERRSRGWLLRTRNPYLYEIETFADILGVRGAYTLNLCYEWGCTSGVWRTGDTLSMLRVLDWPFPDLGRHVVVALQGGSVGDFYNVTWPGIAGVFNAMAPGRFSAALNLAPMRRHRLGYVGDWLTNRAIAGGQDGVPPAHLLRHAFEHTENYDAAKELLATTKIAVPAIFVLAGLEPGQGCVIERLEDRSEIRELAAGYHVAATNHFVGSFDRVGHGWRPREIDSHGRLRQGNSIDERDMEKPLLNWLHSPILNADTRLCLIADAATGKLLVQGFAGVAPVTALFNLPATAHENRQAI